MIIVQDNAIRGTDFYLLQKMCMQTEFKEVMAGDKSFLCIPTPETIKNQLFIEGHRIVLSFIRKAHHTFDTEPRIHADGIIMNERIELASVLYINQEEGVTANGTAFWEHYKYGHEVPADISDEEFDKILIEDANQYDNYTMTDKIIARPNRLLVYKAQKFHSKWPFKISKGERIVCVTFYAKK